MLQQCSIYICVTPHSYASVSSNDLERLGVYIGVVFICLFFGAKASPFYADVMLGT